MSRMRPRGAAASRSVASESGSVRWESHTRHRSEGADSSASAGVSSGAIVDAVRSSVEGKSMVSPRSRTGSTSSTPEMAERKLFINSHKPAAGSVPPLAAGFLALGRLLRSVPPSERRASCRAMSIGAWCVSHDWPGIASMRDKPRQPLRDSISPLSSWLGESLGHSQRTGKERWGLFLPAMHLQHAAPMP